MAGAKGAKLTARNKMVGPRKHHCPRCVEKAGEITSAQEMKPIMLMPGHKMIFVCGADHRVNRGGTILN